LNHKGEYLVKKRKMKAFIWFFLELPEFEELNVQKIFDEFDQEDKLRFMLEI
jgi:hypothetical protein